MKREPNSVKTMFLALLGSITLLLVSSCGGGEPIPDLSPRAMVGREIAQGAGCFACHGGEGGGGVGPAWQGLAGATVELDDGTSVVADAAYLERSIVEPQAQVARGYTIVMPRVDLTSDEVSAIVTYIQELK